jgi:hypothetical protein
VGLRGRVYHWGYKLNYKAPKVLTLWVFLLYNKCVGALFCNLYEIYKFPTQTANIAPPKNTGGASGGAVTLAQRAGGDGGAISSPSTEL